MSYFVIQKLRKTLGTSYVYGPMSFADAQSELCKRVTCYGTSDWIIELVRSWNGLDEKRERERIEQLREEAKSQCQCDLCQCFGQGNCIAHEEECDHCNNGGDPSECQWLLDI